MKNIYGVEVDDGLWHLYCSFDCMKLGEKGSTIVKGYYKVFSKESFLERFFRPDDKRCVSCEKVLSENFTDVEEPQICGEFYTDWNI